MLFVTMKLNLGIYLHSVGCQLTHSILLERKEFEQLLQLLILQDSYFLNTLDRIFLVLLSSRREPDILAMLNIILFCFLRALSPLFNFYIFLIIIDGIRYITQGSSQSVLYRLLVGSFYKAILGYMRHVLYLRNPDFFQITQQRCAPL